MDENNSVLTTSARDRRSCLKVIGISCLVVAVVFAAFVALVAVVAGRNPAFRHFYASSKAVGICQLQMEEIGAALNRYVTKNGDYPPKLEDLYPKFLEKKGLLHCPADRRSKEIVSYLYFRPKVSDPGSKVILKCTHHQLVVPGNPPVSVQLWLYKNGQIKAHITRKS